MQSFTPPHAPFSQMHTTQSACGDPSLSLMLTRVCDTMWEWLPSQQATEECMKRMHFTAHVDLISALSIHPRSSSPSFSFPVILIFHCILVGCRGPTGPTSITLWHSHSADCAIGWGYARYWTGRGKHSNNEMILEPIIQMVHCFRLFN